MSAAPRAITESIPAELVALRQWVAWRPERRGEKTTKIPIAPSTGHKASTTDAATWGTFGEAMERAAQLDGGGVGFVFTEADGFAGIDLDGCIDPIAGTIAEDALAIVREADSYTERSPSGSGLHIILRGALPPGRSRAGRVEMYDRGRFFTMTGHHLDSTPDAPQERQGALAALHARIFPAEPPRLAVVPTMGVNLADDELIERALAARNGQHFAALWSGDTSGHGEDDSAADLALCCHLAFWTGNDTPRIDQLFRRSGLYREKWEREDYRERTMEKAMQHNVYEGKRRTLAVVPSADGETKEFHQTDLGNAERLVANFGENLRYCHLIGRWFVWDGQRWAMNEDGSVERYAKEVTRLIYAEGQNESLDPKERAAIARHAIRSEARDRINAMIDLARTERGIGVHPDQLDAHPHLLTVANGTLNLRTGMLHPHDRGDLITKMIPVDFDPSAECPQWLAFLNQIMAGSAEKIAFLRRAIGYSLSASTDERALFIPWGSGANGKSTLLETVQMLLGDYAARTATQTLMVRRYEGVPNDIAALRGRRFVYTSESEEGERLAEARIKDLTGGDRQTARFMRGEWFDFAPTFKIWLATNHKPEIRGTDNAIWDRIKLIPFTVTIPEGQRVPKERLLGTFRAELPGILAWAVAGAKEWYEHGLGTPDEVRTATSDYRAEMDIFGDWLREYCVVQPTAQASAKELYESYKNWSEESGQRPLSQKKWAQRLGERGLSSKRGTAGRAVWHGIGLLGGPSGDSDPLQEQGSLSFSLTQQGESGAEKNQVTLSDPSPDITGVNDFPLYAMSDKGSLRVTPPVGDADAARDSKKNEQVTLRG
jgi:putative DNA primase/helicase